MAYRNNRARRVLPLSLLAALVLASLTLAFPRPAAAATATLIRTIQTSKWNPPSPDPSGITYWSRRNHLVTVDGEVEEMSIWAGANVFRSTLDGTLVKTYDTTSFNNEPVGVDIEVVEGGPTTHFFISNDSKKTIFDIDIGPDDEFGTPDDKRRPFLTSGFGNGDPEGLTIGAACTGCPFDTLYTVDGAGQRVYITNRGSNGIFESSDATTSFSVAGLGVRDPEGIDYDPQTGNLWIADRAGVKLFEVAVNMSVSPPTGSVVTMVDLKALAGAEHPGDVTLAPGSQNPGVLNLYVVDRAVDNNVDPNENDGRIYEIAVDKNATPSGNLLANPGFESANSSSQPSSWSTDTIFRQSGSTFHEGSFSGRFAATSEGSATIKQTVSSLNASTPYKLSAWVNIPATADSFVFYLRVKWFNANGNALTTVTAATFNDDTAGAWVQSNVTLTPPAGAAEAKVMLVVKNLSATIYVDEMSFGP